MNGVPNYLQSFVNSKLKGALLKTHKHTTFFQEKYEEMHLSNSKPTNNHICKQFTLCNK